MLVEAPFLDLLRGALRPSWRPGTFHYPKQHGTVVSSLLSPAVVTSGVWQGATKAWLFQGKQLPLQAQ